MSEAYLKQCIEGWTKEDPELLLATSSLCWTQLRPWPPMMQKIFQRRTTPSLATS
jgi:hypothetical protein